MSDTDACQQKQTHMSDPQRQRDNQRDRQREREREREGKKETESETHIKIGV